MLPVYAALIAGAVLFSFPLLWLVLTALKPIEQTMVFPPQFVPKAYYAEVEGRKVEVVLGPKVEEPSSWGEVIAGPQAGSRVLVSPDAKADPNFRWIKDVPAGWRVVTERGEKLSAPGSGAADVVPPEAIESRVKLRWGNFPTALAMMGGRSLEELEGTAPSVNSGEDARAGFPLFLANTVIVCVLGVLGAVFANAIIAYGFARLRWPGRDALFAVTIATMMIPAAVLMVPLYGVFKSLGWIGTLLPLWAPAWFGSAFNIFLLRQFFRTLPEDISEAARIDGCSEWRIFWNIILPLSTPALAVVALFHFLFAWNDFMGPLMYLTNKRSFTLALALQEYQSQHTGVQWQYLMAASAVTILPIIVLFFFAQKTFIRGIATTGGKG